MHYLNLLLKILNIMDLAIKRKKREGDWTRECHIAAISWRVSHPRADFTRLPKMTRCHDLGQLVSQAHARLVLIIDYLYARRARRVRRRSAPSRKSDAIKTAYPYTLKVHRQQSLRHVYNPNSNKADCSSATFMHARRQRCGSSDTKMLFSICEAFPQLMHMLGARFVCLIVSSWKRVARKQFYRLCFDGFF